MCEYYGREECTLTKRQVLERGPIIEKYTFGAMRLATDEYPQTYVFKGVPAYYSLGALIPDEGEEDPHAYIRYIFDEDEGCGEGGEYHEIDNPLLWPTEKETLVRLGIDQPNQKEAI